MKIFIGSAKESLKAANTIKFLLDHIGHEGIIWDEIGVFVPSTYTIQNLERCANDFDAAIFVYSEDDMLQTHESIVASVRDNVIFESGLFIGKMGHAKVALYIVGNPKIPSDLQGITVIKATDNLDADERKFKAWLQNISNGEKECIKKDNRTVIMSSRSQIDNVKTLEERWKYAKEITLVNFASTAFIASSKVAPEYVSKNSWRELFQKKLKSGCTFRFLITEPNSYADFDASFSKMNIIKNVDVETSDIISMAFDGLEKEYQNLNNYGAPRGNLEYRTTTICLPYGLILVTNDAEHSNLNHVKVDLYSPYLLDDSERRSFIIYSDNENYAFFYKQIKKLLDTSKKPNVYTKNNFGKISNNEIEDALDEIYRQYFVGDLQREQFLKHIYDSKIEIGSSLYKEFTPDQPHYHKYASEYLYILSGEYRLLLKVGNKFETIQLNAGDFYAIPKHTPYASKAMAGTRILFVKAPGLNDKEDFNSEEFDEFLSKW